jgi:hypothetical protein
MLAAMTLREPREITGAPLIGNLAGFLRDPTGTVLAVLNCRDEAGARSTTDSSAIRS